LDIHFTVGISCERAALLTEKNAAAWHHVLRSPISLHSERPISSLMSCVFDSAESHIFALRVREKLVEVCIAMKD
jgi:hypothetical protein